jgi:nucleoid-associated protein YgaU
LTSRVAAVAGLIGLLGLPAVADGKHIVKPGETLWQIAGHLGDPFLWPALYRANRDQIKDPSILYPGQVLTIPELADLIPPAVSASPPRRRGTPADD